MNVEKIEWDVKLLQPNLSQEGRILIEFFMPIVREFGKEGELLRQENRALKDQLSKSSRNSSKPPSQEMDRPLKRRNEENGSNRPAGGRKGHKG